jgi:hypothetical protein
MLKRLPRMLVAGPVVPFFVVRRRSAVSMRGHIVIFSSFLVRIFPVVPQSRHQPHIRRERRYYLPNTRSNARLNHTSTTAKAMSKFEQTTKMCLL